MPTLYHLAARQNMSTAAFLWPVTAGAAQINYNIPEIFPNRAWQNQYTQSLRASSPFFLLHMDHLFGHLRSGIAQPQLDDFTTAAAAWTLEHKYPSLTLIHLTDLDSMRHHDGVDSAQAGEAIIRLDNRLGQLTTALESAGRLERTNIVVSGDHYQIDVHCMIRLNAILAAAGYALLDEAGSRRPACIAGGRALAKGVDGACYIYFRDHSVVGEVAELIERQAGPYIDRVLFRRDFLPMGADSRAGLMVKAKPGYYFVDEPIGPLVEKVRAEEVGQPYRFRANHGYRPDLPDYQTTFIAAGPGIRQGLAIEQADVVDEGPTLARMLGLTFPQPIDGKVIDVFQ